MRPAVELMAPQSACNVAHPFVCSGGACLYIPAGYFPELKSIGHRRGAWHVVDFRTPHENGRAVTFLMALYRLCNEQVMIVGLAEHWADRIVLRDADVPIVVRNDAVDQGALVHATANVYLTTGLGAAGWSEAILGAATE
jgi:hypothetical protein